MKGRRANHEGSIYQGKDGRWIGELTIRARRRRVSGKSKREVSQRLRILRSQIENERAQPARGLTVEAAMGRLADPLFRQSWDVGRSVTSAESLRWACGVWCSTSLWSKDLSVVRAEDVERAYEEMRTKGGARYSHRSMKQIRSVLLRSMRQELVRSGNTEIQLALTSAEAARFPTDVTPSKTKRALGHDEVSKLVPVLKESENGLVFGLSLLLGLRPSEAAGLRFSSIDLSTKVLYVSSARRRAGSGLEVTEGLKTKNSRRTLGLSEFLVNWIEDHLDYIRSTALDPDPDDLVFRNSAGGILDPSRMRRNLKKLCEHAEINPVTPNELRHTAATLMAERLPLHHVAQILGHSVEVADEFYGHRENMVVSTPEILRLSL